MKPIFSKFSPCMVIMILLCISFTGCGGGSSDTTPQYEISEPGPEICCSPGGITYENWIEPIDDDKYKIRLKILLSDMHGNPAAENDIVLMSRPASYTQGYWIKENGECKPEYTGEYPNEDADNDLILDEDEDANGDGELTPPDSAGGKVSDYHVVTDEDGIAYVDFVYPKSSAAWIVVSINAKAMLGGAEVPFSIFFRLPYAVEEQCNLPDSPYNDEDGLIALSM